ncbi:hypothetical protein EV690_3244 [Celerinatantimonas diazotrophica]|uniref:Uncharacterized protein n=1 Tax=Celerinatantimonas diazotrophica TaxID=412034 RepID=A0A4R1J992_9GAMM|nr:hypothetical protein EV690_3244 [Celerinatantimonas diazotrophica]
MVNAPFFLPIIAIIPEFSALKNSFKCDSCHLNRIFYSIESLLVPFSQEMQL